MSTQLENSGLRVRSLKERAAEAGFSYWTLHRQIKNGTGPKLTRLSPRRLGIRGDHWLQWLDSRA
jgi:predicted DNA-binding transcriptional regulator AlpA